MSGIFTHHRENQSGGGFAIESALGRGKSVTLWFPEASGVARASDPALPGSTALSGSASTRVLVVDDDAMVREALVGQMEEQGYRFAQAGDGPEALAQLDGGAGVDLLISDFAMPGMNGLTLIQEARRRRPDLPVLVLTGYAECDRAARRRRRGGGGHGAALQAGVRHCVGRACGDATVECDTPSLSAL